MDLHQHALLSAAASGLIFWASGDAQAAVAFSVTGVFVDLDHVPDYLIETGFNTDLKRFMRYHATRGPKHLWLVLHSFEAAGGLLLASLIFSMPSVVFWLACGWLFHLLLDQFSNRLHPLAYFFLFRLKNRFVPEKMYGD